MRGVRVVWTSVASAAAGLACLVAAGLEGQWTTGLGLVAVAAAVLAARER